ncbi:hypothetical protein VP1G_07073 [Cytospora mali]|uniref:Uncharacterized protein n=1 Tax=Cytospora mali TaxID=578113 RepID=A0A194V7Q0_CYTMA|nr:hypothetical protein VP1G_07073 [Valsa mali var. pyri (nom. inval.)]
MLRQQLYDNATSNVLAWSPHAANVESVAEEDAGADADEPPDSKMSPEFRRTSVSKPRENHASLLTRALQSVSEGEEGSENITAPLNLRRRRSITSEISLASTADLTSDTGLSTPARTSTPSPRLPHIGFAPLPVEKHHGASGIQIVGSIPRKVGPTSPVKDEQMKDTASTEVSKDSVVQTIEKKRCISFACTAKPKDDAAKAPTSAPAPAAQPAPQPTPARKTCIKFACPARPDKQQTPPQQQHLEIPKAEDSGSLSTVVSGSPGIRKARSPRSRPSPWRNSKSPVSARKRKYITANPSDLQGEICHFHEFASDHPTEDDWIRQEKSIAKAKLTMDDLLKKENAIRRLGKEAEEEAEQEEAEADEEADDDADEDDDGDNAEGEDDIEEEEDIEDEQSGYGSDDDFSDGYNTDEEYGFADSDDEENDGLHLWTFNTHQSQQAGLSDATPVFRRPSLSAHHSDSSTYSRQHVRAKHSKSRSIPNRPMTPELPDSTDFVCGTMDEDRPLEEAYLTRLAARKQEKLRIIPQDIDPSFPTSEPEDNEEEKPKHSHDSNEQVWLHGELEDLHDERPDRRFRKGENASPKRLRSPPPKRFRSPPPKTRGRSPRRLFEHPSPKRTCKSPAPAQFIKSPILSPTKPRYEATFKPLAPRPGLTHTKSLPRGGYIPPHIKLGKRTRVGTTTKHKGHIRGAIDIVKGLEQKRQRRKEKYYQKYCNRARKGQIPEKKAQPGEGAERMRELGLTLAGKIGPGNYVISI